MIFLQTSPHVNISQAGSNILLQYGVLGVFAILLIYTVYYLEKQRKERESELSTRVAKLEQKVDDQQADHDAFLRNEYAKAMTINERCLEVLEDVRDLLKVRS